MPVDWRREAEAARRTRGDYEAQSRTPAMLERFRKEARRELGAAGTPLLAAKYFNKKPKPEQAGGGGLPS